MVVRRYGIYLRVFTSISNEWDIECEHEKINSISPSVHVLFCLLYKHTHDDVIDYSPKISDHFPEISEDFPKFVRRPDERFRTFSEHFPKIAEDCRGRTDNVSIIQQDIWVFSQKLRSHKLLKCDWFIISHVKISYFYVCSDTTFLGGRNPCKTLQFI